jgi:hypothetical protein
MLSKIISGGQTGADQAGWRAAETFGIRVGGRMTCGFLTEDGARPEFADRFGAEEMPTDSHPARTEQNVSDADGTLWFGDTTTAGAQATVLASRTFGKPLMLLYPGAAFEPTQVVRWVEENEIRTLNVAGNHESETPGIGDRVEQFLGRVFRLLGHEPA